MYQILLVEDDKSIREVIADYMDEKGKDTLRLTLAEDGRACEVKRLQLLLKLLVHQ